MGLGLHGQSHGGVLTGVPLAHGTPVGNAGVLMGRPWAALGFGLGLGLGLGLGGYMSSPMAGAHGRPMGGRSWAAHGRSLIGRPWAGAHGTPVSSVYGHLTSVL